MAKLQSPGAAPYGLMVFAGMLAWQFFANSLSEAGMSFVGKSKLIGKVYFPRMIIPISSIVTSFVDFFITFLLLAIMFVFFQILPYARIFLLPFFIVVVFMAALGTGLFIAALNLKNRDFRYIIPFIVQVGLYITPVGFSSSILPEEWRIFYYTNPIAGVIDGFRWSILGESLRWEEFMLSLLVIFLLLIFGIIYFRKTEKSFADIIKSIGSIKLFIQLVSDNKLCNFASSILKKWEHILE